MRSLAASKNRIITLLTDFGYDDPFVGQIKGVILKINQNAKIIDITHGIKPQAVEDAAFVLWRSFKYFPKGTIHLSIVDPGVGSQRKALIVKSQGHYFIAPDNGLLSYVIKEPFVCISIENPKYFLQKESPTFQGRDVFAPAAAWLSTGVSISEFGKPLKEIFLLEELNPLILKDRIVGKIVYIDRFGNAITNIKPEGRKIKEIKVGETILPIVNFYCQSPNKPAALVNSDGFIEIFIYMGNAVKTMGLEKEQIVEALLHG